MRGTNGGRKYRRKLAEINGTLREGLHGDDDAAGGSQGGPSKGSQCCRNCGSIAHITYDCELKGTHVGVPHMTVRDYFDQEYASFCQAVGEQVPTKDAASAVDAEAAISSFYNELDM